MKTQYLINLLIKLKYPCSFNDIKIIFQKIIEITGNRPHFHFSYKIPPVLQLEPANICNINCICCSAPQTSRKKGHMPLNLFQKIIDEASDIGVRKIKLFLHGEPFLHPRLIEMVRYIKSRRNLGISIATNGFLLDKEKSKLLLRSGLGYEDEVVFSILGYSKEVHERVMSGINHEDVLTNIFDFLKLRKQYGSNVNILVTFKRMPENKHEEKQFVKYWRKKVDKVWTSTISKSFREYKNNEIDTPQRNNTCTGLWKEMVVFWNGDVTICTSDIDGNYIVGNLKERSIKEIWDGKQLSSVRNLHRKKQFQKIPLCSKCDF